MRAAIVIGLVVATSQGACPSFEVTSVRANTGTNTAYSVRWSPDGRFRATNITPRSLIVLAYDLRTDNQLMGEPRWIASERFDIEAVPEVLMPRPQQRLMLQALLRDRFGLVMRAQPVDVPVYALVRTRPPRQRCRSNPYSGRYVEERGRAPRPRSHGIDRQI